MKHISMLDLVPGDLYKFSIEGVFAPNNDGVRLLVYRTPRRYGYLTADCMFREMTIPVGAVLDRIYEKLLTCE